jgi:hypothetical protein
MQKAFFKVLRFAAHWPAAQGKGSLFLHPALTSQHGARTAPRWLDVLGYYLYYLSPLRGWCFAGWNVTAPIFISWVRM